MAARRSTSQDVPTARFFATSVAFRRWLARHHADRQELLVGFFTTTSGRAGLRYPEALDEALCFGWIDGVRTRIDEVSYSIRFSPRKAGSHWSRVNIARALVLDRDGVMMPAGRDAFARRDESKTIDYSYEFGRAAFSPAHERRFRASREAWQFFEVQAPSYQRQAMHWVGSPKREDTRQRRLAALIELSMTGRRLGDEYRRHKASTRTPRPATPPPSADR